MQYLKKQLFSYDADGAPQFLAEIAGLSGDSKPTDGLVSGSSFIEVDTGKQYVLDAENDTPAWTEKIFTTATSDADAPN